MKRSKTKRDYDYDDYTALDEAEKKSTAKRKVNKSNKNSYAFLTPFANKIWKMDADGIQPKDIASSICIDEHMPTGSISGHQVSLWMNYQKKSKQGKPRSVSLKNNNMKAENDDDCMYIY
jgi:hypothetical protein